MLTEICQEIKNWFVYDDSDKHLDTFTIEDGEITPSFDLEEGSYIRIIGSRFNDGVHKYGDENDVLVDETFDGALWVMSIPPTFVLLAQKIQNWQTNYADVIASPYQSESFGGYSYSKASGSDGASYSWKDAFRDDLNRWRKI